MSSAIRCSSQNTSFEAQHVFFFPCARGGSENEQRPRPYQAVLLCSAAKNKTCMHASIATCSGFRMKTPHFLQIQLHNVRLFNIFFCLYLPGTGFEEIADPRRDTRRETPQAKGCLLRGLGRGHYRRIRGERRAGLHARVSRDVISITCSWRHDIFRALIGCGVLSLAGFKWLLCVA